jgi:TPR repeat protein
LIFLFSAAVSFAGEDPALEAKHENMKRFYEQTHKRPPTLIETKAAAEKGDAPSQFALAEIYNAQSDWANALLWYRKAAAQGESNAEYHVADILLTGRRASNTSPDPIPADLNEALVSLGRAANQGQTDAQITLAQCYRDGTGVNLDLFEAFKWFSLAARRTNAVAVKSVQDLTLKLRSEQIAAAQLWVNTFVPGKETELPVPSYLDKLKLNGISGTRQNPLAIVNNHTLGTGDQAEIKLDTRTVAVRCVSINDQSVLLQIGPYRKQLQFRD